MPFAFKLSRRLARTSVPFLFVSALMLAACDAPQQTPLEPGADSTAAASLKAPAVPRTVTNLAVAGVTDSSVTLSFKEVGDGTGHPSSYYIRFATSPLDWGTASDVTLGTCRVPMAGTVIGANRTCTVLGLAASTSYQFQLTAFRGTLNVNAVFGALSNVASGTTAARVVVPPPVTNPETVTNLSVTGVTENSATLSFSEVNDGAGQPAGYIIRQAVSPISWGTASNVSSGSCTAPMSGTSVGATRSCTVQGLAASTNYQFQIIAFRGTLDVNAVFGSLSGVASATTSAGTSVPAAVATVTVSPASASLSVAATQQLSAVLRDAGGNVLTGRSINWTSSAPLVALVNGSGLVTALVPGSATITASSEGRSGTASITVTVLPSGGGGGIVFESDWSAGTGTSAGVVTDGNKWDQYDEFNGGSSVQLLSVVPGGPGGRNALKVLQRGSTFAANLQKRNLVPPSTDYYVRFYMRNDDTSPAGDHIVTPDIYEYANLTYIRKYADATGWQVTSSFYGLGYVYPIGHWNLNRRLALGAWYRFEYFVHFVSAAQIQVRIRIYDAAGTQIASEVDFNQSDPGGQVWNGRSDWTLASYYQAGYSFGVVPAPLTTFGVGNNGQQGATDSGLPWYFAGIQIRTDRWPGP
jgi:uncharacterized protein YjdB